MRNYDASRLATAAALIASLAIAVAAASCSQNEQQQPKPHEPSASVVSDQQTLDTTGRRCILHAPFADAPTVDSCSVVTVAVIPPAPPPAPPPEPPPAPPPPPNATVSKIVLPGWSNRKVGDQITLTATEYDASGATITPLVPIRWVSTDLSVATVDQSGHVIVVGPGNVNIEAHVGSVIAWSTLVCTGTAPVPPPVTSGSVASADSFVKSVGVDAHIDYYDLSPYAPGAPVARTVAAIKALGVGFVRTGQSFDAHDSNRNTINAAPMKALEPIKLVLVTSPAQGGGVYTPPYNQTASLDTAVSRLGATAILAFEGPNEVDNNAGFWGGASAYGTNAKSFQCAAYARAHVLGVQMISPTVTSSSGASNVPDLTACADAGAMHPYPNGKLPTASLASFKAFTSSFVKGKPLWITEAGYHTNVNGTVNHFQPGVSEAAAAKYITRQYLDYFSQGIPHSSTYEFIDERVSSTDDEQNFGLLHNDWTPKPAYLALQSMLAQLADAGPAFTVKPFGYTLSGTTSSVRALALEKRSGMVELVLWNDVLVYDVSAKKDLSNAAVPVTVTLATVPHSITLSYPVNAPNKATVAAAKTFTVQVQDSPAIVEIIP